MSLLGINVTIRHKGNQAAFTFCLASHVSHLPAGFVTWCKRTQKHWPRTSWALVPTGHQVNPCRSPLWSRAFPGPAEQRHDCSLQRHASSKTSRKPQIKVVADSQWCKGKGEKINHCKNPPLFPALIGSAGNDTSSWVYKEKNGKEHVSQYSHKLLKRNYLLQFINCEDIFYDCLYTGHEACDQIFYRSYKGISELRVLQNYRPHWTLLLQVCRNKEMHLSVGRYNQ